MPSSSLTRRSCLTRSAALCLAPALAPSLAQGRAPQDAVVINLSLEPDSLDPTMAPAAAVGEVVHYNVLEGLTRIEENGSVAPQLAESWSVSASGHDYVFRLRRGVHFHDGAPLDAAAVRYSFERAVAPGTTNKARQSLFDNIATLATPDAHSVALHLHHPDPHLLFRLGEGPAVILHPDTAAQAAANPVGTGPYRVAQWQRGHGIHLAKADSYRHADQVRMVQASFRFLHDPLAQSAALQAGEIDLAFNFATQTLRRFQDYSHYQVLIGASTGKGMLALNQRRAPLNDVRVRRAITHAIDREGFIRTVLDGRGVAIGSHFSPADAGYLHLASMYPYDPGRARALLQAAGVATPLRLTLALPPAPYAHEGGPVIAQHLARAGIEAELQRLSWEQWLNGPFKGQFDMTLINHVEPLDYRIYTDPGYYFGYDSPAFRALVQRHGAATNARERQQLWAQLQRHLAQEAVNAWIFAPQIGTVVRKGLRGVWMNYPIFVHDIAALRWE
ncbi:ABC transporter substrate-binding protein [Alicycliphilus denitrificans]|uniref:ABC transporter substrate-binding protein n=1 Tax=Alicycliphilus denitrificans TaxID=179636 RepID=UPI00384B8C04